MEKKMKKLFVVILFAVTHLGILKTYAQPTSGWEDQVQINIPSGMYITAATSDAYGQHLLIRKNTTFNHYLVGNNGAIIYSNTINPEPVLNSEFNGTITSGHGVVSVVVGDGNTLKLWRSSDGGASWSTPSSPTNPTTPVYTIDAIATSYDDNIYIVWDDNASPNPSVYFYRYNPVDGWQNFQEVTSLGGRGIIPKVAISSNKVIVSFIDPTTAEEQKKGKSRDRVLGGSWESFYRVTDPIQSIDWVEYSNVAVLNDEVHLLLQPRTGAFITDQAIRATKRLENENWQTPTNLAFYGNSGDEMFNFRRKVAVGPGALYTIFSHSVSPSIRGLKVLEYTPGGGWNTTPFTVYQPSTSDPVAEGITISSSRTGQYVYWMLRIDASTTSTSLRRKVSPLAGAISENGFWTGYNWIGDDTYIEGGRSVLAKSGSVTRVLANKSLGIRDGARLSCEQGSTLICESGAQIIVEEGGEFTADKGTLIKMGVGSQIVVNGSFITQGDYSNHVTLTLEGSSGHWNGIVAAGGESGSTLVLDHADIFHAATAVHVGNTVNFSMLDCTVDDVETGVEIVAMSDGEFQMPNIQLTNNNFTNFTQAILLDRSSNVNIDQNVITGSGHNGYGITCISASPTILLSRLENLKMALECTNGSSPMLEEYQYGGNNIITNNNCGVTCSGGSMPNLGTIGPIGTDVGGQNSIFQNEIDVQILDEGITIVAENNWWGSTNYPPGVFDIAPGSTLVFEPYLESDPNLGNKPVAGLRVKGEPNSGGIVSRLESLPELMKLAGQARKMGNYIQAVTLLKSMVSSAAIPHFAKQWALSQMLAIAQRMNKQSLYSYMTSIAASRPALARNATMLLPLSYWADGLVTQGLSAFASNIQHYPNSELARAGLYGKFAYALFYDWDTTAARLFLTRLQDDYLSSIEARIAARQMASYRPVISLQSNIARSSGEPMHKSAIEFSTHLALENYPNPFNPSTQIKYDLPEASHVTLAVYDVLGRKVTELVNGQVAEGYHTATWNASDVASGIYLARFTVTDASGNMKLNKVNKLILMK